MITADELTEGLVELLVAGAGELAEDTAVPQEDEIRPEAHLERPPERLARSVRDLDVLHLGVALENGCELRREREAVAAPAGPELEQEGADLAVDLVPRGRPTRVAVFALSWHGILSPNTATAVKRRLAADVGV
jgi:hypothetical protein